MTASSNLSPFIKNQRPNLYIDEKARRNRLHGTSSLAGHNMFALDLDFWIFAFMPFDYWSKIW